MSSYGWLRTIYDRLLHGAAGDPALPPQPTHPARIGRYTILHELGAGGMGVVYAARDDRLARTVALKTLSALGKDERARKRFWREARAAASVNHPNICQIYEVGEDGPEPFLVMELLEGESLADRLRRGPLTVAETIPIGLGILSALAALHARGIVHRDLKPSNVFLTPHGVKVLDFGVARVEAQPSGPESTNLTPTGVLIGTPAYMAPEHVAGAAEPRSDLFAVGAILFEMLAGRPAFVGRTLIATLHDAMYEHPPALTGSPAVVSMDRVIRRALAKRADERPASAEALARELEAIRSLAGGDTATLARAMTRLVVLPFRVLRPDPESDFLAFSLPDAIATSLAAFGSVVVRSSAVAARFARKDTGPGADAPDLQALASDADVDRVVMGTLLRSGEQVRTAAQLVEAPGGRLITSLTVDASLGDLFRLQDDIARRVVEALALPLTTGIASPRPESAPHARAYELYLRANELARTYSGLPQARELYRQCLELDPRFAPAWAAIGRCHRVIGKFIDASPTSDREAEDAFRRALDLNPRQTLAHKYYANLEADIGQASRAMVRLLGEAERHGNDPELFAGLVHACRYCGLYEESVAAHEEARRLDPNIPTSYAQTLLMIGETDRILAIERPPLIAGADEEIRVIALGLAGRRDEARRTLLELKRPNIPAFETWSRYLLAWLERRSENMVADLGELAGLGIQEDPEAMFLEGWLWCDVGRHAEGLPYLQRGVTKGYWVAPTLTRAPQFDALRGDPAFQALQATAEAGRRDALTRFREAGGDHLLGRPKR